ncbi:MAG: PEP-CTERM sorting domain-containing protein [Tepidisphaeraceae bacterium]
MTRDATVGGYAGRAVRGMGFGALMCTAAAPAGGTRLLPDQIVSIGEDERGELYLVAGEDLRHLNDPASFIIRVVPEPTAIALMFAAAPMLLRRRVRKGADEKGGTFRAGLLMNRRAGGILAPGSWGAWRRSRSAITACNASPS